MERADRQLYRAKADGRNCISLEPQVTSFVSAEEKGLLFSPSILALIDADGPAIAPNPDAV
jgi:hypothetical protein